MSDDDADDSVSKLAHLFATQEKQATNVVPMPTRPKEEAPEPKPDEEKKTKRPKKPRIYIDLGDDCPVRCLGVNGSEYYFLDAIDQLNIKHADKLGQNGIDDLFKHSGAQRWADEHFGRIGEEGVNNGIDRDLLKRALIARCGDLSMDGVFDPSGAVRGDGVWRDEVGRLVFHCGDVVQVYDKDGRCHEGRPGQRDSLVYPKGTRQMRPADASDAPAGEQGPAYELLKLLSHWNWKRGSLDATLQLGWNVTAAVGGALQWRPAQWLTGDMSTGKSTLQEVIAGVQGGRGGIVQAADATGAGIWQALKFRSLPVAVDEVEAGVDNTKKMQVVELMRLNASGALLRRGGGDHRATEFSLYSCFQFSSINMLPLPPQDISRLALMELLELPRDARRPKFDHARLARIGAALRRRAIMAWPQWDEHLAPWWEPINAEFGRRTADTFATCLAMAHLALCDETAHGDVVEETIAPLIPSLREWQTIAGKDYELMLNHMATWQLEPWDRGRKLTVRQLVYWASSRRTVGLVGAAAERHGDEQDQRRCASALRQHGLAVVTARKEGEKGNEYLAIAFRHSALSRIFARTKWQDGVWRQSAARAPGADTRKVRIEAGPEGAVLVPIAAILGDEEAA